MRSLQNETSKVVNSFNFFFFFLKLKVDSKRKIDNESKWIKGVIYEQQIWKLRVNQTFTCKFSALEIFVGCDFYSSTAEGANCG